MGTRGQRTAESYLVANRKVGVWAGAFSIAATWIWAPAVFVCSQKSYEQGLAGIFWFTVPNIVCFFTFVPIVLRARRLMPKSYSLPDFIWQRFSGDIAAHLIFVTLAMGIAVTGIVSNSLAGGLLLHELAGVEKNSAIIVFAGIALSYSIWRGLPGSVVTDVVQMTLILLIAFILVPWTLYAAGGLSTVVSGLSGLEGSRNVFDPWITYSFGIPATIGLLSGPVCDQMFYQRAMATREESIAKTFVFGGLVFALVPIVLSIFGFIAASPEIAPLISAGDPQLIGVRVVGHFLPHWTVVGFCIMALCALSSTLDSAYLAGGALYAVDVHKRYFRPRASDKEALRVAKFGMLIIGTLGTAVAVIPGVKILWIFLLYGVLAAAGVFPAILAIFWEATTARGAFWGAFAGLVIGLPLSVYGNATQSPHLVVLATLLTSILSLGITFVLSFGFKRKETPEFNAPSAPSTELHEKSRRFGS